MIGCIATLLAHARIATIIFYRDPSIASVFYRISLGLFSLPRRGLVNENEVERTWNIAFDLTPQGMSIVTKWKQARVQSVAADVSCAITRDTLFLCFRPLTSPEDIRVEQHLHTKCYLTLLRTAMLISHLLHGREQDIAK